MRVLITGTTQGIGLEIYEYFTKEHDVYTINRHNTGKHNYFCDLTNVDQVEELCETIKLESWDVLINNAGGAMPVCFESMTGDILEKCMNLNYISPVLLMKAVIPSMKEHGFGRIINISSVASKSPRRYLAHYGASKSALEAFSKSVALYYENTGITINCLCLGGIDTETSRKNRNIMSRMMGKNASDRSDAIKHMNGLGRLIQPKEIIPFIDTLTGECGKIVSGQTINICGTMEVH